MNIVHHSRVSSIDRRAQKKAMPEAKSQCVTSIHGVDYDVYLYKYIITYSNE